MLDVSLRDVSYANRVANVSITFEKSTHTAIVGAPASGISTLLHLISGELRPDSGTIQIGTREITKLRVSRRPLLYVTDAIDAPGRWSVRHVLIAAVRQRSLDRIDRLRELELAVVKWKLEGLLDRRVSALSASELTATNLARIELLKPGIVIADRVLRTTSYADDFYRTLRILGATVISAPSSSSELGFTDRVVIMDRGRVVQDGTFSRVYRNPVSVAAARATGDVNVIPITIRDTTVESVIGSWDMSSPSFQGSGIALARPEEFEPAAKGEESDLIFGIEEATFHGDHWRATGFLTGAFRLSVLLPRQSDIHKGKLIALRYDPRRFTLLPA